MTKIDVKYNALLNNYNDVISNINELMTCIESIGSEFNNLSSSWEGTLASTFLSFSSKVNKFAQQNVLNFKNTEEFKNTSLNAFQRVENTNANNYK